MIVRLSTKLAAKLKVTPSKGFRSMRTRLPPGRRISLRLNEHSS